MKAKVITAYIDRITNELHKPGEEVELTEARAKELSAGGFVEVAEAAPRRTRKAPAKKAE
jgi:hypothetical protein